MKMASRLIDLISKKQTKVARAARFFVFPLRLFCRLQRCFVRLKRQTSQLHIFMKELSYVYPIICFLCSYSLLFFTAAHFHLAGRQQFLIFSPPLSISMFFSLPKGDRYLLKTSRRAAGGIKVVDYPRNVKFSLSSYTFFVIGV